MENANTFNNDKLEFRQIVLKHIQVILKISSEELRIKKTYMKDAQGSIRFLSQEDTRLSYIQAVENLSYILLPYFDNEMNRVYEECIKIMCGIDYEVENYYRKEYEEICKNLEKEKLGVGFVIEMKLRCARRVFVALNLLLNRNDYLKSAVYGEDKDELVSDDEDSEGGC
jgi:hypothetical protein